MQKKINIREVKDALAYRAEEIATRYLGKPITRNSNEVRFGKTGKIVVNTGGPRMGQFKDWATLQGGSMLDFMAYAEGIYRDDGSHIKDVIKRAVEFLGGANFTVPQIDHQAQKKQHDKNKAKKKNRALEMWKASHPIKGTLGERYLRGRGITIEIPDCLRFSESCYHRASESKMPAIIAGVQGSDGAVGAVWRIYLQESGDRYRGVEAKAGLGSCEGGAVWLTPAQKRLYVTEGVETALSFAEMAPGAAIWAARACSFYKKLWVPDHVEQIVFLADGDSAGREAAVKAARHFGSNGKRSWAVTSIPDGWDINDIFTKEAGSSLRSLFFSAVFNPPRLEDECDAAERL